MKRGISKVRILPGVINTCCIQRKVDSTRMMLTNMFTVQAGYGRFATYVNDMPSSSEVRSSLLSSIRIGVSRWPSRSSAQIVDLCLDNSNIDGQINYSIERSFLCRLKTLDRRLCHKSHMKKLQLYQKKFSTFGCKM